MYSTTQSLYQSRPSTVSGGTPPRPPGLASLEVMGNVQFFLFVEASQSHGGAGGQPPADLTQVLFSGGTPPDPQGSLRSKLWVAFISFYSLKPHRATGCRGLVLTQHCGVWDKEVAFSESGSVTYKAKSRNAYCLSSFHGNRQWFSGTCSHGNTLFNGSPTMKPIIGLEYSKVYCSARRINIASDVEVVKMIRMFEETSQLL
ncbi:hypothetical protein TRICI_002774 [Trichomonascus ciferrii]|uniref:Uncharacterized protein n=1 Tax=Trichomonascus ciferrii TaxID=44093 RepID=A0A642V4X7_9ASCO|nr:hypothetical protein TRICI_002774 [Trichomonascus ciferrii]